jgi:hypothetical protein
MNVAEKLAREISRVTELRCRYEESRSIGEYPVANLEPAIFLINTALENAMMAAGVNDAITQIDALKELAGFQ